jgi:DNA-binding HxlR family transcriptional regulator
MSRIAAPSVAPLPGPADVTVVGCSRVILEHITSRWGFLVLHALRGHTRRFNELRRLIGGVSEKMLAQTLQTLERDGLVHRRAYPQIPPRVEYSLTPLGAEAAHHVSALALWVQAHVTDVLDARADYDPVRDGTPLPS